MVEFLKTFTSNDLALDFLYELRAHHGEMLYFTMDDSPIKCIHIMGKIPVKEKGWLDKYAESKNI